jgi:ribosome-binding protein aMBF1 (putative translation factor)
VHRQDHKNAMIRNEQEYREAVERLTGEAARMREQESRLKSMRLSRDEIKRAMDPIRSFHAQLQEDVDSYERLKRGEFDELQNFEGLGNLLVALRIAQGISQRDLAERLGVHESQISRDERNEYRGITVERANRVLQALGVELTSTVTAVGRDVALAG